MKYLILLFLSFVYIQTQITENLKEFNTKREEFYSKLNKYSNGKLKLENIPGKGLSIIAQKDLEADEMILEIPKELSVCSINLFPFKYEITEALKEFPDTYRIGHLLLTFQLLYHFYAPKAEIKEYIKQMKLEKYYNYHEKSENLKYSFVTYTPNYPYFEKSHFELISSFDNRSPKDEINNMFSTVVNFISKSEHKHYILPWLNNFDNFRWVYSNILSRTYQLNYDHFVNLEYSNIDKLEYSHKLNLEHSRKIIEEGVSVDCLLCYADLVNHHQNKHIDLRDNMNFAINTKDTKINITGKSKFYKALEVENNYSPIADSLRLFGNYGFLINDNVFDEIYVKLTLDKNFSFLQKDLCVRLNCFDDEKDYLPKVVNKKLYTSTVDNSLLKYGRVRLLKKNNNINQLFDLLADNKLINFENEIGAWMYYYSVITKNKPIGYLNTIENLIYSTQYYRTITKKLEEKGIDTLAQIKHWGYYKIYEYIYNTQLYKLRVYRNQSKAGVNHIILNTRKDLNKIRNKYLK